MGFDGIEIPMLIQSLDTSRILDWLGSNKRRLERVVIGGGSTEMDISSLELSKLNEGMKYVRNCIEACDTLDGSLVCGPLYSAVGDLKYLSEPERKKIYVRVAQSFRQLGRIASDRGIRIALEPLCRYDTSLVNTVSDGMKMVELIDLENVGLLLDTFHMNIEEKSFEDGFQMAGEKLFHFHACENDRGTPGSGLINWGEVALSLNELNYQGMISIESFTPFEKEFATSMCVWRKLEENQDQIAIKGLKFLKSKLS